MEWLLDDSVFKNVYIDGEKFIKVYHFYSIDKPVENLEKAISELVESHFPDVPSVEEITEEEEWYCVKISYLIRQMKWGRYIGKDLIAWGEFTSDANAINDPQYWKNITKIEKVKE
ncbi:MAG: hypothetical protein K6U04_08685 [Armatimonadetes bacterium]|nr:hypothetical protein [Armatimonadota bacterium]